MRYLLAFSLLLFSSIGHAAGSCLDIFKNKDISIENVELDLSAAGVYFNRFQLPENINGGTVLAQLLEQIPASQPVLIFDTNPSSKDWAHRNIITPAEDALFPGKAYSQLNINQRSQLFEIFFHRTVEQINSGNRPVILIDHHISSKLVSDASTTPLIVDFIQWLMAQQRSQDRDRVLDILQHGTVLRDHADADILLASFARELIDEPIELKRWADLIKQIALFNDHSYLAPNISAKNRAEVIVGFTLAVAIEKLALQNVTDGYSQALSRFHKLIQLASDAVLEIPENESDPTAFFIRYLSKTKIEDSLAPVVEQLKLNQEKSLAINTELQKMLNSGAIYRQDHVLVVRFDSTELEPSGLEVSQILRLQLPARLQGAKVQLVISPKQKPDGIYYSVKMRALESSFSLDPVYPDMKALGFNGGGRSGAGGLYGPAGRKASDAELANDIQWLIEKLNSFTR